MNWSSGAADEEYTKSLAASPPDHIQIIELPRVDPPPADMRLKSVEAFIYEFIQRYISPVRDAIRDIVSQRQKSLSDDSTRIAGLVLDFFCSPMIDVASEFGLPSYIYLTSNASFLAFMFYLVTRHTHTPSELEMSDSEELIPGFVNPVPRRVLPLASFNKNGGYYGYLKVAQRFKDAKGIMVNTFEEIEGYTLNCLISKGQNYPPIYPVGPVIDFNGPASPELDMAQRDKMMKWLDGQPESSVVFLCFGSKGSYGASQVKEIALGLEQSGFRFLWSLRTLPPFDDQNPEEMLPEGFLERIQGKGMICGWAPQLEILGHKAIGGFVSHCGWNSILESLWYGVPIVTWPMYAEQQLNAFMMKELGLAVVMRLDYWRGQSEDVKADEIEKAVGLVMDGGSEVRKKVKEMSEMARKAIVEGGSSFNTLGKLLEDIIGN
ncbi:UDP-glucuronosyl/UDP-glucosyltransferase [Corchorus capsularis]|uniref:Glycosyltransferase n=1 Tax=Corchorus capsularis TaxID=210143 RepID=A0A1R3IP15_COCAP|nr:UDP-glucuronosyl/UDP-glucosyltransferase [Corchorus capsularis]